MTILVTGATGHVGGRIAQLLSDRAASVRRLARTPAKAPALPGASVVQGDYGDRAALDRAMRGIDTVFLASGNAPPLKRAGLHGNVIDAAAKAGVRRLVYLSFQNASATSPFPYSADHLLTEAHLKQSGVAWTILRDSFYLDLLPDLIAADGTIRGPASTGEVAWVAREDVAQVAATVLLDDAYAGRTLDVTGPEAFGLADAAARLSKLTGRTIRYENETVEEGRAWRAASGAPDWEVDVWLGSYLAMASGELAACSTTVADVTSRMPQSLETFASKGL